MQNKVKEFHQVAKAVINDRPTVIDEDIKKLRIDLIDEEFTELKEAMGLDSIVDIADALGDLLYVIFGTAISYGINMEPIFNEIQRSNMTKFPNGKVLRSDTGKILKPDTFEEPELAKEILKQICGGKEL